MYGKTPETLNFQGFLHLSWSQLTLAELRSAAGGFETVLARLFCQKPLNFTWLSSFGILSFPPMNQSRIRPSLEIVTTCQGMNLPLALSAFSAALWRPPQQGTSIRTIVTLLISLFRMISVSFSE